jgi:PAS domain S-box-containing protein
MSHSVSGVKLLMAILNRTYGVIILWIITILIRQHKSVQDAFHLNESKFETIFDQSPIGKGILNQNGNLVRVNKAFINIFGLDDIADTVELNLFEDPNLPANIKEKLKNKASINYEIEYDFEIVKEKEFYKTRRNQVAYLQEIITPLLDPDRKINGFLLQVQDITSRKNTEINLKKAITDLESSNKELEKFAYVASHDLQEPLRMIGSFTQLLAKRYEGKLDKDADEFINYAVEGANRMHQLINDLLTYSRLTTRMSSFSPVDCNTVLEKVFSFSKI